MLVVLLELAALLDAVLKESSHHPLLVPLSLLYAAPLLLRRVVPFAAPGLIAFGFVGSALLAPAAFSHLNLPFFCAIVATVFVGALPEALTAAVGGLALVGAVEYANSRFPDVHTGDYVFLLVVFGAAWLVGRALATRASRRASSSCRCAKPNAGAPGSPIAQPRRSAPGSQGNCRRGCPFGLRHGRAGFRCAQAPDSRPAP